MLHPATTLKPVDPTIGLGVFATEPIPRGCITWVRDPLDQVLTPAAIAALPAPCTVDLEHYFCHTRDGNYLLCWDIGRYVNHSCTPNCFSTEWGFEIAVRDIAAGEQLTNDYANIGMMPTERLQCRCGAPGCRGVVSPADAFAKMSQWTSAIAASLAAVNGVRQPLWALLAESVQEQLRARYPVQSLPETRLG
jgi:hypothetical protein